jgi:hypothetical protein
VENISSEVKITVGKREPGGCSLDLPDGRSVNIPFGASSDQSQAAWGIFWSAWGNSSRRNGRKHHDAVFVEAKPRS